MNLKIYCARISRVQSEKVGQARLRKLPNSADFFRFESNLTSFACTRILFLTSRKRATRLYSTFSFSISFYCITKNKRILYSFFFYTTYYLFLDILYRGNQLGSKQGTDIVTIRTKMIDGRGNGKSS